MLRKAAIFGIKGVKLSIDEVNFLKRYKPWGIILFSRNIQDIYQLKTLIISIKKALKDENYPILIDQEGGKVSRLDKIIDLSLFSQDFFGKLYTKNKNDFKYLYELYVNKVCEILNFVGVNIITSPVLDVRRKKSHNIIGSRSFSENQNTVSKLGNICIKLFNENKIGTVIKHIPGHGLSLSDSHYKLPIVKENKKKLIKKDFSAFKKCNSLFAMTAHIVYESYDPINAATHSKIIIDEVIRKNIGFNGILISDDISMKALRYGIEHSASKALQAGCNLIMHCNGNLKEMYKLAKIIPTIDKFTHKKTTHFYKFLG